MDPFPAEHELLGILGEPLLTDENIPWSYNRLIFQRTVGTREVTVVLEPGEAHLEVRLSDLGSEVCNVVLSGVPGLVVEDDARRNALVTTGPPGTVLRLQVLPALNLYWSAEPV